MQYQSNDHTFVLCAYKESKYLEECILSLLHQTVKSNILISTSTPNDYIKTLAEKYSLPLTVNIGKKGIGGDWNWGYDHANTPLVTIAHQDDIYEPNYTKEMLVFLNRAKNPIMYFSGYAELRNGQKVYQNKLLNIKKLLLFPLKWKPFWQSRFIRRRILSLGSAICCPAVTMVKERFGNTPFLFDFLSNVDWQQWEIQSRKKGAFVYNEKPLMCHRIHEESTTSEIIGDHVRTKEDFEMLKKFWPVPIARFLMKFYIKGQSSNNLKK